MRSTAGSITSIERSHTPNQLHPHALHSHATFLLEWCDKIKLSNLLLPRKSGTIKGLQLLSPIPNPHTLDQVFTVTVSKTGNPRTLEPQTSAEPSSTTHCTLHTTHTTHDTRHTTHYTHDTLHTTQYTHYTLHTTNHTLHTSHSLHTSHYTLHASHFTL
jgi:hypothetical protein